MTCRDCAPCERCGVPANRHYSTGACRGYVPARLPLPFRIADHLLGVLFEKLADVSERGLERDRNRPQ